MEYLILSVLCTYSKFKYIFVGIFYLAFLHISLQVTLLQTEKVEKSQKVFLKY